MAGPRVFTTDEWQARPATSTFPKKQALGIVVHNTENANRPALEGEAEESKAFEVVRGIQGHHMAPKPEGNGWSDTGQHGLPFVSSRSKQRKVEPTKSQDNGANVGSTIQAKTATGSALVHAAEAARQLGISRQWMSKLLEDFRIAGAIITNADAGPFLCRSKFFPVGPKNTKS